MRRIRFLKCVWIVLALSIALSSCRDEMEEHYKAPSWSKGSAWETLKSMGDYSTFLECVDLSGLKPILEGKGLSTVMAPNDEAFKAYFNANGISSPSSLTKQELIELVGLHIFYYAYDKQDLINFRPLEGDGATEEQLVQSAGLFHKFRTRCSFPTTTEYDKDQLKEVTVYHLDAMMPVFSHEMFESKQIDAKASYEYFYPNSTWNADEGFQVGNASVIEYEIPTDNGYIYTIDQVLEPMKTLYEELASRDEFSMYVDFVNRNSYYLYDEHLTSDFGSASNQLYLRYFRGMPYFAIEWYVSDYRSVLLNMYYSENVFAPKNSAFDSFFTNYWKGTGYEDYEDVKKRNPDAITTLLENTFLSGSSLFFPQDATQSENTSTYGDYFDFDYEGLAQEDRKLCLNGALYGVDKLIVPAMFESVVGPAYKYPDYSYYVSAISRSGLAGILSTDELEYTTIMPSNEQIERYGWILSSEFTLQELRDDGYANVSSDNLAKLVNGNTCSSSVDITAGAYQVFPTNQPWNYWYITADGKMTFSSSYSQLFYEPSTVVNYYNLEEIPNGSGSWSNGKTYKYSSDNISMDEMLIPPAEESSLRYYLAITPDANRPHYKFAQLMFKAGLTNKTATDGKLAIPFLADDRFVAFIPTNEVIEAAIAEGKIPGVVSDSNVDGFTVTDEIQLAAYLKIYFVPLSQNGISSYPYLNSGINGSDYVTMNRGYSLSEVDGEMPQRLKVGITTSGTTIKFGVKGFVPSTLVGEEVEVLPDYNYYPFAFGDGCAHYINGIL
ncbi:MAG: fasciclin domain-containing protein [Bacteroidales bacterium]